MIYESSYDITRSKLMKLWHRKIRKKTCFCYLCGEFILKHDDLSTDHVVPKSKGGSNSSDNLKPAHKICNSKKNDKTLEQYLMELHEQTH